MTAGDSKRVLLTLAVVVLGLVAGCGATPNHPAEPGWVQLWHSDFTGPAGAPLTDRSWHFDLGTCYPGCAAPQWGTQEIEVMTDSTRNVALDGAGHLAITPIREADEHWTSGRIETTGTFAAPAHGVLRVEASIQQPDVGPADGDGYWPAFWLRGIGTNGMTWPTSGEIDILENVNGRPSMYAAMHCGIVRGGICNEPNGISSGERPCPSCGKSFHRYAMELDLSTTPGQVRYYLDGTEYFRISADRMDELTWHDATKNGFTVILNVAMGGVFPAGYNMTPNASTASGRPMLIDSITVSTRQSPNSTDNPVPVLR